MELWENFLQNIRRMEEGYVIASFTGEYLVNFWNPETKEEMLQYLEKNKDTLLEVRVFGKEKEWKCFRTDIGKTFQVREISETTHKNYDTFDEVQVLDFDGKVSKDLFLKTGQVQTIGGGRYHYPFLEFPTEYQYPVVRIRYYLEPYEETGQARIRDYRLVGFEVKNKYGKL